MEKLIFTLILLPIFSAAAILMLGRKVKFLAESLTIIPTLVCLIIGIMLFGKDAAISLPWAGFGMDFLMRLYHFSGFILLGIAFFAFLIVLYSIPFLKDKPYKTPFYAFYLINTALAFGAVLSDNLILFLFFWEGLLLTLFGLIAVTRNESYKTATKAFVLVGVSDLCMMAGIAITAYLAGTFTMSKISLPITNLGSVAFLFLMIGAIGKSGSMPFHSWIPDAATDASLPFMAFLPGALEKMLGIYFLTRISLDLFKLAHTSWLSTVLMVIGAATILLAVMMALVQKEYKRLLSYHAISQVGYMVLGIGTCVPVGIVGGIFHMINNAIYKSALFLTGGSVEKTTGTTKLENLGGLGRLMPITFICFLITAASISGVPPFNGFFSKELIYDAALERGKIFYLCAIIGSFLTAASFLKLGHSVYLGKIRNENKNAKDAPILMMVPMVVLAGICIFFGVFNVFPIQKLIQPILGAARLEGHDFSGMPHSMVLVAITVLVLVAAVLNHYYGFKKYGQAVKAVDHIHHAPIISEMYDKAEKRIFDPYDIGLKIASGLSVLLFAFDRVIDWIYDVVIVRATNTASLLTRRLHDGNLSTYVVWSVLGIILIVLFVF